MTPLVMLPGMMCDDRLFVPQIEAFSGARAVTVPALTGADRVEDLAFEILRQAPDRFALAGLSMGGIVAMEMMRQAPDRIAGLCLMDTNPLAEDKAVKAGRLPQIEKAMAGRLDAVMREEMKPRYLTDGPRRAAILDLCMEMALALGPDVFVAQSKALMDRPDQMATLRAVTCPSLILCGAHDTLCPVSRHELMADLIGGAVLEVVPKAGHLPVLEAPQVTTAHLAEWLSRL